MQKEEVLELLKNIKDDTIMDITYGTGYCSEIKQNSKNAKKAVEAFYKLFKDNLDKIQ